MKGNLSNQTRLMMFSSRDFNFVVRVQILVIVFVTKYYYYEEQYNNLLEQYIVTQYRLYA